MAFKGIKFLSILFTGIVIGWIAHDSQKNKTVHDISEYSELASFESSAMNCSTVKRCSLN